MPAQDGKEIIRAGQGVKKQPYICFNETFFKNLERMQLDRGIELMKTGLWSLFQS